MLGNHIQYGKKSSDEFPDAGYVGAFLFANSFAELAKSPVAFCGVQSHTPTDMHGQQDPFLTDPNP
jgi:hypothetical protein